MKTTSKSIAMETFESIKNSLPLVSRSDGGSLLLYIKLKNINNNYLLTFAEDE